MKIRIARYIMTIIAFFMTVSMEAGIAPGKKTVSVVPSKTVSKDSLYLDNNRVSISFEVENSEIRSTYRNNGKALARLRGILKHNETYDSIMIYSLSSPDGPAEYNMKLSALRGDATKQLLLDVAQQEGVDLANANIKLITRGESWNDIKRIVDQYYKGDNREKLLAILQSDATRSQKTRMLERVSWKTWEFVRDVVIPEMRSSVIVFSKHKAAEEQSSVAFATNSKEESKTLRSLSDSIANEQDAWKERALSADMSRPVSVLYTHQHVRFNYRVNQSDFDSTYMSNKENADKLKLLLSNSQNIDNITVFSFASPEGSQETNLRLSKERGEETKRVITDIAKKSGYELDSTMIKLHAQGENWDDLKYILTDKYTGANKSKLLDIISSDISEAQKKRDIKHMGKKTWRYVIDDVMPILRSSEVVLHYPFGSSIAHTLQPVESTMPTMLMQRSSDAIKASAHDSTYMQSTAERIRRTRLAVKTNMLYDALTWVNFSIEVPFKIKNQKFSATYDHQFPWWRVGEGNNEYCNRYLQIGGEARWWFAPLKKARTKKNIIRECLAGHFVGLYGMGGKYDFEWGRKICYQGEFWSAGLTYGYAMPISKLFNLEFSVSLGYASIVYRHYIPSEDFGILYRDIDKMGTLGYFGVTKLGVSLVMPLNFNYKAKARKEVRL